MSYASWPNPAFGYYRSGASAEGPLYGGQGSMAGQGAFGVGFLSQGQGSGSGGGGWDPTIVYLLILVIVEMIVFGFIARALR